MTLAERLLAAHRTLEAHGVRLDGHDLTAGQMAAMAAIADGVVDPAAVTSLTEAGG
jgi:hypothetical protein